MNRNCPNCGAPIEAVKCPYCGTLLLDFADIDTSKPTFVRIKMDNRIYMVKVRVDDLTFQQTNDTCSFYADDKVFQTVERPELRIGLQMTALYDEDGIILRRKDLSDSITSK